MGRVIGMMNASSPKQGGGAERRPFSFRRWGLIAVGVLGVAILISLCVWQLQRLAWKEGIIAKLDERLASAPVALPKLYEPPRQEFSRVRMQGTFVTEPGGHGFVDAPLLTSKKLVGPGYRLIQPFDTTDGRRVMVDRGFMPVSEKNVGGAASRATPAPSGVVEIIGALRWPEVSEDQPYGTKDNVWTARDLSTMARLFGAEQVLIIAETSTAVGEWPKADPLRTADIRNNHVEYAITWAALAFGWAGMTLMLIFAPGRHR